MSGRSQASRRHDTRYNEYCVNCSGYDPVPAWALEPPYPCLHHRNSQTSDRCLTVNSILPPLLLPSSRSRRISTPVPLPVKGLTAQRYWLSESGSVQERSISDGTSRLTGGFGRFQGVVLPAPELKTEAGCQPCLQPGGGTVSIWLMRPRRARDGIETVSGKQASRLFRAAGFMLPLRCVCREPELARGSGSEFPAPT